MIVLNQPLSINQAWNHYNNTFLLKYKDIINGKVKEQETTTGWTGIMVAQKYIWHMNVGNEFQLLRENNTGTPLDGRTFGEFFEHFVL